MLAGGTGAAPTSGEGRKARSWNWDLNQKVAKLTWEVEKSGQARERHGGPGGEGRADDLAQSGIGGLGLCHAPGLATRCELGQLAVRGWGLAGPVVYPDVRPVSQIRERESEGKNG